MQTDGWSSLSKGRGLCDNTINSLLLKREASTFVTFDRSGYRHSPLRREVRSLREGSITIGVGTIWEYHAQLSLEARGHVPNADDDSTFVRFATDV